MNLRDTFTIKVAKSDTLKVHSSIKKLESQWLGTVLIRAGVPRLMLDRRSSNKLSNMAWRNFLFDNYFITVDKELDTGNVSVHQFNSVKEEDIKIAEWSMPDIIRVKEGGKTYCKLNLKYWQIV